ncbi:MULTISPECIES: DCC1-like thiol-disulfide oxidoreductase family protein [unclassified Chryseobacterium]|uniref:DCC1-like thiol-disulfide oxidoreductase family protein n=1 Tax=unclassified Chryseobacterium TaxID=2593645 RepID=UPI0028532F08|nr:DCC1-like thiol-disulfide oxidoreductase family protein [Chryseobacterium sp. CFS7]MDR4892618.1 DCC1-like thiol-disulfide oxidoreductase family protein [Chryseobacterium sp. CFS7]
MKTLKNHTLIYDNECPMCNLYSKGFTKCGMLDEDGREAFTELSGRNKSLIDFNRAKNEIALVDHTKNEVVYGLDSLLLIIGNSFPWLVKMARIKPLYWFFQKLYSFVSYNRKQIIPSPKDDTEQSCIPDFNLKYRIAYISFVVIFSAYILSLFSGKLNLNLERNFLREFAVCLGQIAWQAFFLKTYLKDKIWDYIGNMMTVSLIGTLLLIPALMTSFTPVFYIIYFGIVVLIMFLEHIRRCRILKLNFLPTISWILFRITALAIIILTTIEFKI